MQTKFQSLVETIVSTFVGLTVSMLANAFVLPLFGFHPTLRENALITAIFTVISIARGFLLRRIFNYLNNRGNKANA